MSAAFFFVAAAAFILVSTSSFGFCSQIVSSNDEIPASLNGIVSFRRNNLVIASFPTNALHLKTLTPGSIKLSMDFPLTCNKRTITLSYGSSQCKIRFLPGGVYVNTDFLIRKPVHAEILLTNEEVIINGQTKRNPCSSMSGDIRRL